MNVLEIDWKNFIAGESLSDAMGNGGFSPESYGLNLTKTRGMLYFNESTTDLGGATLTGNVIATTYDKNLLGNDAYFLDDEGAFYYLDGSTLTKAQSTGADTFVLGTSDIIQFLGNVYATGNTRIILLTGSDLATIDSAWWTGLTTSYRHPLERVEDKLYIGDLNVIHTWDGTTSVAAAITLPTDVNITSLRKHPDGRNLIAFCGLTANFSHLKGLGGRIYIIDTNLKSWVREIEGVPQVEGSRVVGGVVYCTYGFNVGYFNGNGITFLKKLLTSATTYSHNLCDMEGVLVVRDGRNALAYGDLGAGNVWWNLYKNIDNTSSINNLCYKGDNVMVFSYSDGAGAGLMKQVDYDNAGVSGVFYSNRISFEGEAMIRRFGVLHDRTNTSGTSRFLLTYNDWSGAGQQTLADITYVSQDIMKTRVEASLRTDLLQLTITPSNDDLGYRAVRIYYDSIEQ